MHRVHKIDRPLSGQIDAELVASSHRAWWSECQQAERGTCTKCQRVLFVGATYPPIDGPYVCERCRHEASELFVRPIGTCRVCGCLVHQGDRYVNLRKGVRHQGCKRTDVVR